MVACRQCGRIWAPRNDPGTCPCGEQTRRYPVKAAMRFSAARQVELRERRRLGDGLRAENGGAAGAAPAATEAEG